MLIGVTVALISPVVYTSSTTFINSQTESSSASGLSGVASIFFRDEESIIHDSPNGRVFYDENIAPFKAELELWYVKQNKNYLYFPLIFLTVLGIFSNKILNIYKIFPSLPPIPTNLKKYF